MGTTRAIARPRLVITNGIRSISTWSISARQRALKVLAMTSFSGIRAPIMTM